MVVRCAQSREALALPSILGKRDIGKTRKTWQFLDERGVMDRANLKKVECPCLSFISKPRIN
jgi:hypothetical protein